MSQQPYYASKKILGKLYRSVNEQEFLNEIRRDLPAVNGSLTGPKRLLERLYDFFKRTVAAAGIEYNIDGWSEEARQNQAECV
jgi:hypothetical protein